MSHRSRLALGLAGGYLLGRYRKTRWLLAVAALVASKRLGEAALQRGGGEGGSSPELKKLADQGRDTAASLLANQLRGLSSRIHDTTESLQQTPGGSEGDTESESPEQPADQSAEQPADQSAESAESSTQAEEGEEGEEGEEATEQSKDQADSEEPAESASSSNSTGSTTGRKSARRSGNSRGSGAASGERAQVSGRPDGLGAARRRR